MIDVVTAATRLPLVLVVDPVAESRFAMWRLLSRSFGVLEAPDAQHARRWLTSRRSIDAMVVQTDLPDVEGTHWIEGLIVARVAAASRAILVGRPVDAQAVVTRLTGWFFSRDPATTGTLQQGAHCLVS